MFNLMLLIMPSLILNQSSKIYSFAIALAVDLSLIPWVYDFPDFLLSRIFRKKFNFRETPGSRDCKMYHGDGKKSTISSEKFAED